MARKIAEELGIDKRSVNRDLEAASVAIDEPIDLYRDTPEELQRKAAELEKADTRQRAEPKVGRPKPRKPAPRVEDATPPAEPHAGATGSKIEVARKAFDALDSADKPQLVYYACLQIGLDPLKMAPPAAFGLAEEEPELDVGLPTKVAPATDAVAEQVENGDEVGLAGPEQGDDGADLGAEDLPVGDDDGSEGTADGVSESADQENLGAEDLQDAGEGIAEAADQEPGGAPVDQDAEQHGAAEPDAEDLQDSGDAASCAYCNMPLWREVPCEVFNDRIYHAFCVEDGKRLAKAKQGKQIAIAA